MLRFLPAEIVMGLSSWEIYMLTLFVCMLPSLFLAKFGLGDRTYFSRYVRLVLEISQF